MTQSTLFMSEVDDQMQRAGDDLAQAIAADDELSAIAARGRMCDLAELVDHVVTAPILILP